ncbi:hypothetical protein HD593_000886 [Nonomuraea rubra]|uniref:Uncharacterized protein n=1 Tax=Nonomuraea rubra TaxID=46180 RepID=A0A7X0TW65_9ACTN|nr:hypothetical protein [Nonomuraea rubra]
MSADSGQETGHLLRQVLVHVGVAVEQPVPRDDLIRQALG